MVVEETELEVQPLVEERTGVLVRHGVSVRLVDVWFRRAVLRFQVTLVWKLRSLLRVKRTM